jgi:hypothetical protein
VNQPITSWIEPPPPQKRMGCFAKGCLILVCFVLFLGVAFVGGTYVAIRYLRSEYLPRTRTELPIATATEQEQQAAVTKWETFDTHARAHEPARIEFTGDELTALIAAEPVLRGKAQVSVDGDIARLKVTIPLTNMRWLNGHYMNGECTVQSGSTGDPSELRITNIVVNDRSVPDEVLQMQYGPWSVRRFFNDWSADQNLKTIEIRDGKVILETRGSADAR